jgi:hypothetical protein
MPGKRKPTTKEAGQAAERLTRNSARAQPKTWKQLAAEQGVKPIQDFDQFVERFRDVWPHEEEIDAFVAWLQELRREGPKDH